MLIESLREMAKEAAEEETRLKGEAVEAERRRGVAI
jgi:hypothetical protein